MNRFWSEMTSSQVQLVIAIFALLGLIRLFLNWWDSSGQRRWYEWRISR